INRMDKIQEGSQGSVGFLSNLKYEPHLYQTLCSAVIVSKDFKPSKTVNCTLIRVADAYTGFTKLLEIYAEMIREPKTGVEQPSFLGENSTVGEGAYRGAFSYIGSNVKIG